MQINPPINKHTSGLGNILVLVVVFADFPVLTSMISYMICVHFISTSKSALVGCGCAMAGGVFAPGGWAFVVVQVTSAGKCRAAACKYKAAGAFVAALLLSFHVAATGPANRSAASRDGWGTASKRSKYCRGFPKYCDKASMMMMEGIFDCVVLIV